MKALNLFKIFAAASLLLVFTSCDRYDEGSNFSLLTAKARLVNTWTLSSVKYTSGSTTSELTASGTLTILKDGTYSSVTTITYPVIGNITSSDTGKWVFNDDKTQVLATPDDGGDLETWTIVRLKNKELAITTTDSNDNVTRFDYVD